MEEHVTLVSKAAWAVGLPAMLLTSVENRRRNHISFVNEKGNLYHITHLHKPELGRKGASAVRIK